MKKRTKVLIAAAAAAVAVLAAGGTVLAVGGDGDEQLSGDALDRATVAALAETGDGRVTEAEQEDDGTYELEVTRPDGSEVDVHLDASLDVTRIDEDGRDDDADADDGTIDDGGRGDDGGGGDATDADDLAGEVLAKATAAAKAEVPDGIVTEAEHARSGGYEVTIVRPDGVEVDVHLDDAFTVTSVREDPEG